MAFESVTVVAGGRAFEGWEDVAITSGWNQAEVRGLFRVSEVPDRGQEGQAEAYFAKWHFPPYTSIQVFASGNVVLTGYVDVYNPRQSQTEHSVSLLVRGNQMNMVDSSAYHPTGEWVNAQADQIIRELCSFVGVEIGSKGDLGPPVSIFRLRKGSTIYAEAIRLLQPKMATVTGMPDGSAIVNAYGTSSGTVPGQLRHGWNIEAQEAKLSGGTRFSDYYVIDQNPEGTENEDAIAIDAWAPDPGVPFKRNKIIIQTMPGHKPEAQKRAVWEAARAFGYSCEADITVRGWRDDSGAIWRPGGLVFVWSPVLKIDQQMFIEAVELKQDNQSGTTATLHVVNPAAYGIAVGHAGSAQMWTEGPDVIDNGDDGGDDGDGE